MNVLDRPRAVETLCLLKAAFLEGEEALSAWQQWCRIGSFDDLPGGAYFLFPRLYQSLRRRFNIRFCNAWEAYTAKYGIRINFMRTISARSCVWHTNIGNRSS